jgi:uncharacterized protein
MAEDGSVVSLWRYPIKSMMGEELNASFVGRRGLLGDRARALVDATDGKVASAKNPRKWPALFEFRAAYASPPEVGKELPPARITLPQGDYVLSGEADVNGRLSEALGRQVEIREQEPEEEHVVETTRPNPWMGTLEEYWPDIEGLAYRDTVTDEAMPEGTFFDLATVHVLTTATLDQLRALYPAGCFEVRRFRPNIVVQPANGQTGFVENDWIERELQVGEARLRVTRPCPRCVMTTLPQGDLPKDPGILRAAAQHNAVAVGVYAAVVKPGHVRRGDAVVVA